MGLYGLPRPENFFVLLTPRPHTHVHETVPPRPASSETLGSQTRSPGSNVRTTGCSFKGRAQLPLSPESTPCFFCKTPEFIPEFMHSSKNGTKHVQLGVGEIAEPVMGHLGPQNLCPSSVGTPLKHTK